MYQYNFSYLKPYEITSNKRKMRPYECSFFFNPYYNNLAIITNVIKKGRTDTVLPFYDLFMGFNFMF
jgi:hypothetical protein